MLVRVAERIRCATSVHAIADCVIEELSARGGRAALVLCDRAGEPRVWIGSTAIARDEALAFLDGGFRDDPCFAHVRATCVASAEGRLWIAPILGGDGLLGILRVVHAGPGAGARSTPERSAEALATGASWHDFVMLAACISIRLAILGVGIDEAHGFDVLTPRQREIAELVAHGCTNLEIGRMLAISSNAVKKHVSRVLALLEVTNRTELAALTGRWRLAAGPDRSLPPSSITDPTVVLRNPAKPVAAHCRRQRA